VFEQVVEVKDAKERGWDYGEQHKQ
jgi:hypothetical protein